MKKSLYTLSAAAFMLGGLVGCAGDNNTAGTQNADNARQIGYYSNENVDRGNGNGRVMEDNDGPLAEIMDRNSNRNNNEDTNLRIKDRNRADNRYETNNRYGSNRRTTDNKEGNNDRDFGMLGNDRNGQYFGDANNQDGTNNRNVNRQNGNKNQTNNNNNQGGFLGLFGNDNDNNNADNQLSGKVRNNISDENLGARFGTNHYEDGANPYANRGFKTSDNRGNKNTNNQGSATKQSKQDKNYHGHLDNDNNSKDTNDGPPRASAYNNNNNNGNLVQKIVDRVEKIKNVDDARAVAMGDNIIIAIDTHDNNDKNVGDEVRKEVKDITKGKDVRVVTDEATYTRVRDIDNNIRNGRTQDTIDADFGDLFENVGEALRRPFQTNNNR